MRYATSVAARLMTEREALAERAEQWSLDHDEERDPTALDIEWSQRDAERRESDRLAWLDTSNDERLTR